MAENKPIHTSMGTDLMYFLGEHLQNYYIFNNNLFGYIKVTVKITIMGLIVYILKPQT